MADDDRKDEFFELLKRLHNRGRWGEDDELGALNHITPAKRAAAASLVRKGATFSLGLPLESGVGPQDGAAGRVNPMHFMTATGCDPRTGFDLGGGASFTDDFIGLSVQGSTQWDALCHVYYEDELYNGAPASCVDSQGASRNGIDKVHDQFVSRGVLIDAPALRGVDCLGPGEAITTADLEAAEERQGVRVERGDVLLVRTGHIRRAGPDFKDWATYKSVAEPGLHWETAEWLADREVAAVAADNTMVEAAGVFSDIYVPFHMLALTNLGIHLGEFWNLEGLAADCAADGVYECLLVAQALRIDGGTGSPLNPLALK